MTTIAYKDGIVAYESRVTAGNTIIHDDYEKCVEVKGVQFILAGDGGDFDAMMGEYFGTPCGRKLGSVAGMVIDSGRLWAVGVDPDTGFWKDEIWTERPQAMGSGQDHAFTAMDMGATAVEAVNWAIKRDIYSGGIVRQIAIKPTA